MSLLLNCAIQKFVYLIKVVKFIGIKLFISYYLFYLLTSHSLFNSIRLSFPLLHCTYVFSFPSILKSDVQFIFSFYLIYFYFLSCLCGLLDLSSVPSFSRFYVTYHKKFEEGNEIIHSVVYRVVSSSNFKT